MNLFHEVGNENKNQKDQMISDHEKEMATAILSSIKNVKEEVADFNLIETEFPSEEEANNEMNNSSENFKIETSYVVKTEEFDSMDYSEYDYEEPLLDQNDNKEFLAKQYASNEMDMNNYGCSDCNTYFSKKSELLDHMESMHGV